ncbi:MAG: AAA family ATPase, partial [Bacteroidales bacterium]|nr:AAA family ATPase [Bacteroidales bacterium]
MKFPLGIQDFSEIRKESYVYIDKTDLIYRLATSGKYYFLSRPRRFGKSLLLSTLEAYFSGRKELFDGLNIAGLESKWEEHPVYHLDLNTEDYSTVKALKDKLNISLSNWEALYGSNPNEKSLSTRFEGALRRASEKTGKGVVVLVDEYDKPLLQAIGKETLQSRYRSILKAFYSALKSCDRYIRFAFLTGVTKFGKVSIFSDLNNLTDLTFDRRYTNICGITEKELHNYFDDSVAQLAEANGVGKEECYAQLREYYDGYHFGADTEGLYNPYSLLSTLSSGQFGDYWYETGTPTFLVQQLQKTEYQLENITEENLSSDTLNSIDTMDENPLPLLYQSGYLTIKDYDKEFKTYRLGFPNREVREGFIKYLSKYYIPKNRNSIIDISQFVKDVRAGKVEEFMQRLATFFAKGDYAIMGDKELYFQNAMYVFFTLLGLYVEVERHTTDGRMDILVQTKDYVYIFELKIDKSADKALRQIED